ncbi:MAG: multidrug efflux MFS transporter [Chloroflexales bacterium]|nr:multidrug efflux MFS transporter [Chloroflexales bacterium]
MLLAWWDWRTPNSILGQSKIQRRALIVLILFGLCMQFGFVAFTTQVRNVLQAVFGYDVVRATLALVPLLVGMFGAVLFAARRLGHAGPRPLLAGGLVAGAAVCALAALTSAGSAYTPPSMLVLGA